MEERECPFCHKIVWAYSKYCMYCNQEMPPWNPKEEESSREISEVEEPVMQAVVQPEIEVKPVEEPVAQAVVQPEIEVKPVQESAP